ncbi:hypothetical protein SK128_023978 [Halocaridina rubra]|uniref:Uncharacterized protein n=1 Tax=Halocaridina rubra TaxID=373956 RepID=A0AAN8WZJ8_HALRR
MSIDTRRAINYEQESRVYECCMMANKEKIQQYEHFLNNILKQDLKEELERRDKLYEEIANYSQLKQTIDCIIQTASVEGLRTQVDLGSNFYVQAHISDVSYIYLNVGLGIHLELTLEEALSFINKRMNILNEKVTCSNKKSAKIKGDIRYVYELLRQLQGLC